MDINNIGDSIGDGLANAARVIRSSSLFSWIPGFGTDGYQSVQDSHDTGAEISEAITTYGPAYVVRGTLAQDKTQESMMALGILGVGLIIVLSIFRR